MKGKERREKLINILKECKEPITGKELSSFLGVSRQVIVQDITLLRTQNHTITATTDGYVLNSEDESCASRVFKVNHTPEQVAEELNLIVDLGGEVKDVFVYHKVYGTVKGEMSIRSRRDVQDFMEALRTGKSSLLMNVTDGYHYHTVTAPSEMLLDLIQEQLKQRGFLAKLQDYEPVDFWKNAENRRAE